MHKTPDKSRILLQPGSIGVHRKWQGSSVVTGLNGFFNEVKMYDLGEYDFRLPNLKVVYLNEAKLVNGIEVDGLKQLQSALIVADRNTSTVQLYSKLQETLYPFDLSLVPVGHMGEIPLLLHQLSLADTVPSPGSNFRSSAQSAPDVQVQLLLNVPGLGRAKASKLLDVFGSVQRIGFASVEELVAAVGVATGSQVHRYFNGLVNS